MANANQIDSLKECIKLQFLTISGVYAETIRKNRQYSTLPAADRQAVIDDHQAAVFTLSIILGKLYQHIKELATLITNLGGNAGNIDEMYMAAKNHGLTLADS